MALQCFKRQLAIFGSFDIPVSPETSLTLMNDLKEMELIPSLVQSIATDPQHGSIIRKAISLTNQSDFQVIFNSDRIDFFSIKIGDDNFADFLALVKEIIIKISLLKEFDRIGFVIEGMDTNVSPEQHRILAQEFCPHGATGNVNWRSRWVQAKSVSGEEFNSCVDLERVSGGFVENGVNEVHDSIKIMVDICTAQRGAGKLFSGGNISPVLELLLDEARTHYCWLLEQITEKN